MIRLILLRRGFGRGVRHDDDIGLAEAEAANPMQAASYRRLPGNLVSTYRGAVVVRTRKKYGGRPAHLSVRVYLVVPRGLGQDGGWIFLCEVPSQAEALAAVDRVLAACDMAAACPEAKRPRRGIR
jgi:hypothetical protein